MKKKKLDCECLQREKRVQLSAGPGVAAAEPFIPPVRLAIKVKWEKNKINVYDTIAALIVIRTSYLNAASVRVALGTYTYL